VHLHNDLIRGLIQNVIGGAPPDEEAAAMAAGTLSSVASAVAMLQREEGPAEGSLAVGAGGARRKRPLAEVEGGVGGDDGSGSGEEEEEEEQEEVERSAKLQRVLQEAFGGRSAVWDVWAPMRGPCRVVCCCACVMCGWSPVTFAVDNVGVA
jgi:hypothetical protein